LFCYNDVMEEKNFISTEKIHQEIENFRDFAFSKNLIAMALTIILASTVQKFVTNISEGAIMPLINFLVGTATQGNWRNLVFTPIQGLDFEVGKLTASFIEFIITTFVLYLIYIKIIKRIYPEFEVKTNLKHK